MTSAYVIIQSIQSKTRLMEFQGRIYLYVFMWIKYGRVCFGAGGQERLLHEKNTSIAKKRWHALILGSKQHVRKQRPEGRDLLRFVLLDAPRAFVNQRRELGISTTPPNKNHDQNDDREASALDSQQPIHLHRKAQLIQGRTRVTPLRRQKETVKPCLPGEDAPRLPPPKQRLQPNTGDPSPASSRPARSACSGR